MGIKIIAKNKRASYDFSLKDKFEAGIVLAGTEVKSIRSGKVKIAESHITIDNNAEIWIHNMSIPQYDFGNIHNHDETRKRKLLLHTSEIVKIFHAMRAQGLTVVPTIIYFKSNRVKLEIALAKGKKEYDKRHDEAKKDVQRKLQRGIYE